MTPRSAPDGSLRQRMLAAFGQSQHRNAGYLTANTMVGAAAGVLFWLILVRLADLPPTEIGIGYAIIALGTTLGVVAKGGLDTALVRNVPRTGPRDARRLLALGIGIGSLVALVLTVALAAASHLGPSLDPLSPYAWLLVALLAVLLVVTWLQDAWFIGEGDAKATLQRNLVFSVARLTLPLPLVLLAVQGAVALSWALALLVSALLAFRFGRVTRPETPGHLPRRVFVRSAIRNITGSSAEFLPGLLLAPLVLTLAGAEQAAYFGMAWTGASLLFLVAAAIGRSALAELVRPGTDVGTAVRRASHQLAWLVAPPALVAIVFAPFLMGLFGPAYAAHGADTLVLLALSAAFVAPTYLYLSLLRAQERPRTLVLFPAVMVLVLVLLTPLGTARWGIDGAALAWLVANIPFGAYAALRLRHEAQEVNPPVHAPPHRHPTHME